MKIPAFLILILASLPSWACPHTDAAADRRDRLLQRKLAAEYAKFADFIYIADVKSTDAERSEAELKIIEQFKGLPVAMQSAIYEDRLVEIGGCSASFFFQQKDVVPGNRYVIYVKNGKILRAGDIERTNWFISLRDEIRIIKKSVSNQPLEPIAPKDGAPVER